MKNHMIENDITVRAVRSPKEQKQFLELPYQLYKGHPHWIPQLRIAQQDILNTRKHPFYQTSEVEKFLALRAGKVVGRIMAIVNRAHNEYHQEQAGFFGFFEVENNFATAKHLLDAARDWLQSKGAQRLRGPVNPSTNYECGLLVQGFDQDPAVMMPYNFAYYAELLEGYGMHKMVDLFAYEIGVSVFNMSEKLKRVADRLKSKYRISLRNINMKDFKNEVQIVRRIYNDAWSNNWGFVPVSEDEFKHLANDMKQIVDPSVVFVAERLEDDGSKRPIGFFLAVPDINRALKKTNGNLFPTGLLKLLWHSRQINYMRIITMGVVKEFQPLGIAAVFYDEIYRRAVSGKFKDGEMSWVLENNMMMNRSAELIGGKVSKVYRIYETRLID
ncbi:MAG: N-acetyltransferase [Acidobacteria bacterium]|nr:N-acetyltransferase [Acidobacteriota bacterium]